MRGPSARVLVRRPAHLQHVMLLWELFAAWLNCPSFLWPEPRSLTMPTACEFHVPVETMVRPPGHFMYQSPFSLFVSCGLVPYTLQYFPTTRVCGLRTTLPLTDGIAAHEATKGED